MTVEKQPNTVGQAAVAKQEPNYMQEALKQSQQEFRQLQDYQLSQTYGGQSLYTGNAIPGAQVYNLATLTTTNRG